MFSCEICKSFKNTRWLLLEISDEPSLYSIWERWMVSFRGTYWLSSTYSILLCLFRFFQFLSFLLTFLWILLLFGFEVILKIAGNKAKGWISKRVFQENKARQIFQKRTFLTPCRNVRFSENLGCFVFLKQPFWDSPFCLITDEIKQRSCS